MKYLFKTEYASKRRKKSIYIVHALKTSDCLFFQPDTYVFAHLEMKKKIKDGI